MTSWLNSEQSGVEKASTNIKLQNDCDELKQLLF